VSKTKPFDISKRVVWEAYERVKANKGAPGVGPEVDPAVCATVVVRAGATAGWHTGRPGSRDSAGVSDLTFARESVSALCVRRVDAAEVPVGPV
jgi:2-methylisocitrate lyase-like PEP mutase family enzyme